MVFVFICCLIATLFAYNYSRGKNEYGLILGFVIVTLIQAIRFDYGTDMPSYAEDFRRIVSYNFSFGDIFDKVIYKEPGWALLCFAFKNLGGFYAMTAFISVIENIAVYRFINQNVERKDQFFAVFIYLFTFSFYMLNMSMLRQGLAICLGLFAYECIKKNKTLYSVGLAIAAYLIHTSAIILILLFVVKYLSKLSNVFLAVVIAIIFLGLWIVAPLLPEYSLLLLGNDTLEQYSFYVSTIDSNMGFGFIVSNIPFIIMLYLLVNNSIPDKYRFIVIITLLGYALSPLEMKVNMFGRIALYYAIFRIASIPIIIRLLNNSIIKAAVVVVYIGFMFMATFGTLNSESFYLPYKEYQTIFSNWQYVVKAM